MIDAIAIGQIACKLQQPLVKIRGAATALNLDVVLRLNGVSYYSRGDMDRIDNYLRGAKQTTTEAAR